jgi:hypothetical protein
VDRDPFIASSPLCRFGPINSTVIEAAEGARASPAFAPISAAPPMWAKPQQCKDGTGCSFDHLKAHNSLNVVNKPLTDPIFNDYCRPLRRRPPSYGMWSGAPQERNFRLAGNFDVYANVKIR